MTFLIKKVAIVLNTDVLISFETILFLVKLMK